jgi:hypothetical protein
LPPRRTATAPAPRRQRRRVARPSALTAEARPHTRVAAPLVTAPAPLACPSRLPLSPAPLACPSRLPFSPASRLPLSPARLIGAPTAPRRAASRPGKPNPDPNPDPNPNPKPNPNQASSITPGKRAPSVMNLDLQGWVSVSALVEKSKAFLRMVEP